MIRPADVPDRQGSGREHEEASIVERVASLSAALAPARPKADHRHAVNDRVARTVVPPHEDYLDIKPRARKRLGLTLHHVLVEVTLADNAHTAPPFRARRRDRHPPASPQCQRQHDGISGRGYVEHAEAVPAGGPRGVAHVHLTGVGVLDHNRPGADDAILGKGQLIADAAIHA